MNFNYILFIIIKKRWKYHKQPITMLNKKFKIKNHCKINWKIKMKTRLMIKRQKNSKILQI